MDLDRKLNAALNLFQELIPELFYLPEMFVNSNNVSLHLILLSYVRQRSVIETLLARFDIIGLDNNN